MSRQYFKVGPSFWTDHAWNDDERLVALYLLTCPHRTTEGLFRLPLAYAVTDLGWTERRFDKAFACLVADGFVEYDNDASVCWIVNALKWQAPGNPNQAKAAVRALQQLPQTPLLNRFAAVGSTLSKHLAEGLREGFPEGFADPPTPAPPPTHSDVSGGMSRSASASVHGNGSLSSSKEQS